MALLAVNVEMGIATIANQRIFGTLREFSGQHERSSIPRLWRMVRRTPELRAFARAALVAAEQTRSRAGGKAAQILAMAHRSCAFCKNAVTRREGKIDCEAHDGFRRTSIADAPNSIKNNFANGFQSI